MISCNFIILGIVLVAQGTVANVCQAPDKSLFPYGPDPNVHNVPRIKRDGTFYYFFVFNDFVHPNRTGEMLGSIGLYANPCSSIKFQIPSNSTVPQCPGLAVKVNIHENINAATPDPRRPNVVSATKDITSRTTIIKTATGGIVHYKVPTDCQDLNKVTIIMTATDPLYEIPMFTLGITKKAEWNKKIRKLNTPWGEAGFHYLVFTIPSSVLINIDGDELEDSLKDYQRAVNILYEITGQWKDPIQSKRVTFDHIQRNAEKHLITLDLSDAPKVLKRGFIKTTDGKRVLKKIGASFVVDDPSRLGIVASQLYSRLGI